MGLDINETRLVLSSQLLKLGDGTWGFILLMLFSLHSYLFDIFHSFKFKKKTKPVSKFINKTLVLEVLHYRKEGKTISSSF